MWPRGTHRRALRTSKPRHLSPPGGSHSSARRANFTDFYLTSSPLSAVTWIVRVRNLIRVAAFARLLGCDAQTVRRLDSLGLFAPRRNRAGHPGLRARGSRDGAAPGDYQGPAESVARRQSGSASPTALGGSAKCTLGTRGTSIDALTGGRTDREGAPARYGGASGPPSPSIVFGCVGLSTGIPWGF